MARKGVFKRVGAGVIAGTFALFSCNKALQHDDNLQPRLRSLPTPRPATSSTTAPAHDKAKGEIRRHAVAFQQEVRTFSTRTRFRFPQSQEAASSQPKLVETTAAVAEIEALTTPTRESLQSVAITSSVADNSRDLVIEDTDEVLTEGTVIQVPVTNPIAFNTTPILRLDPVSGIADSFASEMLQAISARVHAGNISVLSIPSAATSVASMRSSTALVPVRRMRARAPYTVTHITSFSTAPRATVTNSGLVFALLADRSVIRPSLSVPGTSQNESSLVIFAPARDSLIVSTPPTSFVYSPRPLLTYEAETPVTVAGLQTNILPADSTHGVVEELDEDSSSPVYVDSATQTEDLQQETLAQAAPADDLLAENDNSPHCSSDERSSLESGGSSKPETPSTSRSISPPQFSLEEELAHHQEEIDRLSSLVRALRADAEDHETTEDALTEDIQQLEREKRELEDDVESLRSQLTRANEEIQQRVNDGIEVYERQRRFYVTDFNNAVGAYEARAAAMYKKMMLIQDGLLKAYATENNLEKVVTLFNALWEYDAENTYLRDVNTRLDGQVRQQEGRLALFPAIEREVQGLIRERDTLRAQRDALQAQRNTLQAELNQYGAYFQASYNPPPKLYQRRS